MSTSNKLVYTIDQIREKLIPIFKQYGLKHVGLFGSYARGKAKSKSDIDLLTYFDETFGLEKYGNFETAIKKALNKKVDILDYRCIHEELKEDILKDEVLLYDELEQESIKNYIT